MLERDSYPAGVPCWVDTEQVDPEAAVGFYGELFGWAFEDRMPAGSSGPYLVARLRGRAIAGVVALAEGAPPQPAWNTYIAVESADAVAARVREAGGSVLVEPFDVLGVGRMAVLADPSGAVFCGWEAKAHKGAQLVNEPATWNWSDLHTPDPEGAEAFYGAVFGWEADGAGLREGGYVMWRLPGYADFLETIDPELRRRHAELGAPEGFSDAIGWMVPMTSDRSFEESAAHWTVTFAVDDTNAIAERAVELGGKVVVAPVDVPPVRIAVLSDPQGAVFTVNTYQPG